MTELLNTTADDAISEALRAVRIRSTIYCRSSMRAPWGFGVEAHGNPAFHVVTEGGAWLEVAGESGQAYLAAGDLVVLPTGRRHWLRDAPDSAAEELEDILAERPLEPGNRLRYGSDGATTVLVCGGFEIEGGAAHPILDALPSVVVIGGVDGRPPPWVAATLDSLAEETASSAPGSEIVVSRVADVLLTQVLRGALTELESGDRQAVRALRDRHIAAAIELIHRHPDRAWTVGELAAEVALSRSAFGARFRALVGESPKRYMTRARLANAAALLHSSDEPLAQIAEKSGYQSEFSFGKAFKRQFGLSPGAYRGGAEVEGNGAFPR